MFNFYLKVHRTGLITFCGSEVNVKFDVNSKEGKFTFREFDNGRFKNKEIISKHSNIVRAVIIGKKGWGLWVNQWSDGIVEGTFTKREILEEFEIRNITIPGPLLKDFENRIINKTIKKLKQWGNI